MTEEEQARIERDESLRAAKAVFTKLIDEGFSALTANSRELAVERFQRAAVELATMAERLRTAVAPHLHTRCLARAVLALLSS